MDGLVSVVVNLDDELHLPAWHTVANIPPPGAPTHLIVDVNLRADERAGCCWFPVAGCSLLFGPVTG